MRKTELLKLHSRQIDGNRLTLDPEMTKNCKRRIIPLNALARSILDRRKQGTAGFIFPSLNGLYPAWHKLCEHAEVMDFRIHDLRHTFASWLVLAGVPLLEVRDLLGHSSIKMTERYAHLSQDALMRAVTVLERIDLGQS